VGIWGYNMELIKFDKTPPVLQISRGEIKKYKISFPRTENTSHMMWGNIVEGEFVYSQRRGYQQRVLYRAVYKKQDQSFAGQDNAKEDILLLTIDSRGSDHPFIEGEDPNYGRIASISIADPEIEKECILSIDLGNTRTVSLLIDKVDDMQLISDETNGINIYPVPMLWSEYPKSDPIVGGFESIISLVNSTNRVNSWCFDDCRRSFVKLGEFAVWNNRACRKNSEEGRYTLSSPKRYYWDQDPVDMDWIAARYEANNQEAEIGVLEHPLAEKLVNVFNVNGDRPQSHIPPAAMLGAMVIELYEQAVYYISSREFKQKTNDNRKRKISKVHITYPSTLSPEEKEYYRRQLQTGLNTYLSTCPDCAAEVVLSSDIDEATAVLALYVFSEIKNFSSAKFWLQTIGRKTAGGNAARIAVIDIGGGTTDLSISNVYASDVDGAVNPAKATINLIFRDGINSAGDNFVLNFLKNSIADIGFQGVLDITRIPKNKLNVLSFKDIYNDPQHSNIIRGLKRSFWFDFVIGVASKCDDVIARMDDNDLNESEIPAFEYALSRDASSAWKRLLKEAGFGDKEELNNAKLKIQITKDLVEAYKKAIKLTFTNVAKSFGHSINAYDTDVVLFSGKTAEFKYIQKFFQDYMAISPMSIKPMKDFFVGNWCNEITDSEGRVSDSKISTALGGALYTLREKAFVTMDFRLDALAANPNCRWGIIVNRDRIAFANPLFEPGTIERSIPFSNVSTFIARQNELATTAVLSYEVRLKPECKNIHIGGVAVGATVTITRDTRSMSLSVTACNGMYADGNPLSLDDIECRICNLSSTFGLDNERI